MEGILKWCIINIISPISKRCGLNNPTQGSDNSELQKKTSTTSQRQNFLGHVLIFVKFSVLKKIINTIFSHFTKICNRSNNLDLPA
jgi:Na+/melibiose symporter-like transporter